MKGHFNGITVEGTPAEIAEYQRIISVNNNLYGKSEVPHWKEQIDFLYRPKITCQSSQAVKNQQSIARGSAGHDHSGFGDHGPVHNNCGYISVDSDGNVLMKEFRIE